jgi:hypothetical protein
MRQELLWPHLAAFFFEIKLFEHLVAGTNESAELVL